jgi:hypothetical protein
MPKRNGRPAAPARNMLNRSNTLGDNLAHVRTQALRRRRPQRAAEFVWRLGAWAFFEFVDDLGRHNDIHDLDRRLERYASVDADAARRLGGDRIPPLPRRTVGGRQ